MIISLSLTKAQQGKLKKIFKSGNSDKIRLTKAQLVSNEGPHFIKLNLGQTKQVMSAINRKKGVDLAMTKEQLVTMNKQQAGGFFFLPFLAEAVAAAAPYVVGAVGSYVAEKAVHAIGDALFGGGLAPYKKPQEGGAWYDSKQGEDTYLRSNKDTLTVCFEKSNPTKGKIVPEKRGRSKGRPKGAKNKPKKEKPMLSIPFPEEMEGRGHSKKKKR
jgi:hypothetical protein